MSTTETKDKADLSLPDSIKLKVGDRNVMVKRVPFGARLKVLQFYSRLFSKVAGGLKATPSGKVDIPWGELFSRLPDLLEVLKAEWTTVLADCTDIDLEWADQKLELKDFYEILQAIFKVNRFSEAFGEAVKEAGSKKK